MRVEARFKFEKHVVSCLVVHKHIDSRTHSFLSVNIALAPARRLHENEKMMAEQNVGMEIMEC